MLVIFVIFCLPSYRGRYAWLFRNASKTSSTEIPDSLAKLEAASSPVIPSDATSRPPLLRGMDMSFWTAVEMVFSWYYLKKIENAS